MALTHQTLGEIVASNYQAAAVFQKYNIDFCCASPIAKMKDEHLDEGEQLQRMASISNHYTPPGDACSSFATTYEMLKEYGMDMHHHIHLENNILFPAALKLEEALRAIL